MLIQLDPFCVNTYLFTNCYTRILMIPSVTKHCSVIFENIGFQLENSFFFFLNFICGRQIMLWNVGVTYNKTFVVFFTY